MMKVARFLIPLTAVIILSDRARAQDSRVPGNQRAVALIGCYVLEYPGSRAAVMFNDAPTFIRLDTTRTRRGFVVSPGPGRTDRNWQRIMGDTVSWEPIAEDSLTIFAPYGFWRCSARTPRPMSSPSAAFTGRAQQQSGDLLISRLPALI